MAHDERGRVVISPERADELARETAHRVGEIVVETLTTLTQRIIEISATTGLDSKIAEYTDPGANSLQVPDFGEMIEKEILEVLKEGFRKDASSRYHVKSE